MHTFFVLMAVTAKFSQEQFIGFAFAAVVFSLFIIKPKTRTFGIIAAFVYFVVSFATQGHVLGLIVPITSVALVFMAAKENG